MSPSIAAIEPSNTMMPSEAPSLGEMKTSPAGRLPPDPGLEKSPSSDLGARPFMATRISVPPGFVTRTETALEGRGYCAAAS